MSATDTSAPTVMVTSDGIPLKVSLRRALRRNKLIAFGLTLPLFAFVLVFFIFPIGQMLFRSIDNPEIHNVIPRTLEVLSDWDEQELPPEIAYRTLVEELIVAQENQTAGRVGARLNREISGMRSVFSRTLRNMGNIPQDADFRQAMIDIHEKWGDLLTWQLMKIHGASYTSSYYLASVDLTSTMEGGIELVPENERIYVPLFQRTLWISFLVTALCILLAYPISFLMATIQLRYSNLLMIMVLLPFWTSLLVRTTSWIVILQTEGVLNDIMVFLGILGDDGRIQMIYNKTGTIVAMTHILLPFMVLPLYSVMKTIPPSYMRAARSLGAPPFTAFRRIYLPQTIPGVGAGSILVFILALGYYITPALVGGESGTLISNLIAYHMQQSLNWGLAAALGTVLLVGVLGLYWAYNKVVGIDNMKLG